MTTETQTNTDESSTTDCKNNVVLRATDITKKFSGLIALQNVSLDVRRGEIVGLIGPNGAGKTTLFNCISGVLSPTEGKVQLEDKDILEDPAHKVARNGLSRTFQIARPLEDLTVLENALVGAHIHTRRRGPAEEIAREQLQFVGLGSRADEKASELTVSDQKRLELARALATKPKILLLDEIMAGLTPTETRGMLDLFREIREAGMSILIIEHDMESIMDISNRVKVIDNGESIAFGPPESVANEERVIEAYIGGDVDVDLDVENNHEADVGTEDAVNEPKSGFEIGGEARRETDDATPADTNCDDSADASDDTMDTNDDHSQGCESNGNA